MTADYTQPAEPACVCETHGRLACATHGAEPTDPRHDDFFRDPVAYVDKRINELLDERLGKKP